GLLYDRGDGCSSIKYNYTDYAIGNTSNLEGIIPQVPLPAYYRKYKIGLISADTTNCTIAEKITKSISDDDIGIIMWTSSDRDLPDSSQTLVPVFSINSTSSNQLKSELQEIYDGFIKNSSTYRVLRVKMVPFQPLSPNFWFVSMISVAGVLILSFFVSIILHVRIHRGRRRQVEQIRFQRENDEALGMKKWTLDKEVIGTFPVIIYSRKISSTETGEEKESPEDVVENKSSSDGVEGKGKTDDVNNISDDGIDEQSRQHKLCRKSSTRSTKSQRSERAVGSASLLYSSPDTDTTSSDHISNSETRETCAICLEDFDNGDEVRELPCRHWYHVECIDPWLTTKSSSCPLCKKDCKPENAEGDNEQSTVVDIQEIQDRESRSSQVVDDSQSQTPGSSSQSSAGSGVIWFMSNLFRPRSRRQREIVDESEGGVHLEMENIHTSGNV
ncbi:10751_t:CDS:1, partial [Acaulospora morrowiae]